MRYWVYISDKVEGPFEEEKLVTLQGFTPDTLICAEDAANSGNQEWAKASSIFEFDQVPAAAPAAQPQNTSGSASAQAGINTLLLDRLDALTAQISGMQAQIDGMQVKINEAVATAQEARANIRPEETYIPPQDAHSNTITLSRHDLASEANLEAPITNTDSLVSKAEDMVSAAAPQEQPMDMLGPVDLGENQPGGEEVALSSAMDSFYSAQVLEAQTQKEKETTFQDLLTPAQAAELAAQADAMKKEASKLDGALKSAEEAPAPAAQQAQAAPAEDAAKEAVLAEFSAPAEAKADVIDQVIKEKQEEPLQPMDFTGDAPALTIAPDAKQPEVLEEVLPASQMPADQPAQEAKPAEQQPAQAADSASGIPSIDDMAIKEVTVEDKKEETMQELVPGAKMEKPSGIIITEADLKDAFTERDAQSDQSVEQLFGIDQASKQQQIQPQTPPEDQTIPALDAISKQTADQPLPVANPNDLTEIQLNEGSTYLISDFVPPATTGEPQSQELTDLQAVNAIAGKEDKTPAFTEIVASTQKMEEPTAEQKEAADVTVSQVILENTIKAKRGATMDIRTVPMVPEPEESERIQIDGLDDDLNAQHDLKSADDKPGKSKVMGLVALLILAVLIYVMLAFMNLIPAQFNFLASNKQPAAQQMVARQDQMNEMLADMPSTAQPTVQQLPQQMNANPMAAVLDEVKRYPLVNGYTLKEFIEAKHPAAQSLITWDISTAVDPDNYSILVKVPPENPQSFKISYRFNYNTVTKALDPTISDAKNLLDSANRNTL